MNPWITSGLRDVGCSIIKDYIIDISDLISFMGTSHLFRESAKICVRHITSDMNGPQIGESRSRTAQNAVRADNCLAVPRTAAISDTLRLIPIDFFIQFPNLQTLSTNIYVILSSEQIGLLSLVPNLVSANFYINTEDIINDAITILNTTNLLNTNIISGQLDQVEGIIVQNGLFIKIRSTLRVFTDESISTLLISKSGNYPKTLFIMNNPQLDRYIKYGVDISNAKGFINPVINGVTLLVNTKEFLRIGDFGLIDPTQPPSATNLPLSSILSTLDFATQDTLRYLLTIYGYCNGLTVGRHIRADDLIIKYFGESVRIYNECNEQMHNSLRLDLDKITYTFVVIMIMRSLVDIRELDLYKIPNRIADPIELNSLKQQLDNIRRAYRRNYRSGPLYLTDGTMI